MRCTFERECTAQTLLDPEKQKLRVFGKFEYRKMGVSIEDRGLCFRITRIFLLIGKIFPGIILGICNFSKYTKSIRTLAGEISSGKERTIHYIRTFAENRPRLESGANFLKTALRISSIQEELFSADCSVTLQFDDGLASKSIADSKTTKQKLSDRIQNIKHELLDEVLQRRASLQKITLVAILGNDAAQQTFSVAKIDYNVISAYDTSFFAEVPAAKVEETLERLRN